MKRHLKKSSQNTSRTVTTNDDARSVAVVNPSINDLATMIDPAMEDTVVVTVVVAVDGTVDLEIIGIMTTDEVVVASVVPLRTDEGGILSMGVVAVEDIEITTEEEEEDIKEVEDIRIEGAMVVVGDMAVIKDMVVERTTEVEEATAVVVAAAMEATATSSQTNSPNSSSSTIIVDNNSQHSNPPSSTPSRHKEATATTINTIRITNSTDSRRNQLANRQLLPSPTSNSTQHTTSSRAHINRVDTALVVTAIRVDFLSLLVKRGYPQFPHPHFFCKYLTIWISRMMTLHEVKT